MSAQTDEHSGANDRSSSNSLKSSDVSLEVPTLQDATSPRASGDNALPGKRLNNGTHYILSGHEEDPLVVMVHGVGSYHMHFDRLAKDLVAANYLVLRYDLIGRGYSSFPHEITHQGFSAEPHVKQLRDLLEALQFTQRKYSIIGHSMGKKQRHNVL